MGAGTAGEDPPAPGKGCWCSVISGFILTFLALAIAVGVGVITYFVARDFACRGAACTSESCIKLAQIDGKCYGGPSCYGSGTTSSARPPSGVPSTSKPPGPDRGGPEYLLPKNVVPYHYNLRLQPNIYSGDPKSFTNDGTVEIFMQAKVPTSNITLNVHELTIVKVTLSKVTDGGAPGIDSHRKDTHYQFLILSLDSSLQPGERYKLTIEYTAPLKQTNMFGLYYTNYKKANGQTSYGVATQMEPTFARQSFPCFDEPWYKTSFNATVIRKQPYRALFNSELASSVSRADGWVEDTFEQTPLMPTYLVALVIGELQYKEGRTRDDVRVRLWSRPQLVDRLDWSLTLAVNSMDWLTEYLQIPYPLKKIDLVAPPQYPFTAMENLGLCIFAEKFLAYDRRTKTNFDLLFTARWVTHELAHQWFGDLVTTNWWDDIWLNEGFAVYMEFLLLREYLPAWNTESFYVVYDFQKVLAFDSGPTTRAMTTQAYTPEFFVTIFDLITYQKGSSVIGMMRHFLGAETFQRSMTRYLNKHANGNANHNQLWEAIQEQANEDGKSNLDIAGIMNPWVLQSGYPLVTVQKTLDDSLILSQRPFLKASDTSLWSIPLTVIKEASPTWNGNFIWLKEKDASLLNMDVQNGWYLLNYQQLGYYRVNYDTDNWRRLQVQLVNNHDVFHVRNRAQLLDDSFTLAREGMLSYSIPLSLLKYLHEEDMYAPLGAVEGHLEYLWKMLAMSAVEDKFKALLQRLANRSYTRLGLTMGQNDPIDTRYQRVLVSGWASRGGHQQMVTDASNMFQQWKRDPSGFFIHPDMKPIVLCAGIRYGRSDDWRDVMNLLTSSNQNLTAMDVEVITRALSCTEDSSNIARYLDYSIDLPGDPGLDSIGYMLENSQAVPAAWYTLRENRNTVFQGKSDAKIRHVIGNFADLVYSKTRLDEFDDLVSSLPTKLQNDPSIQESRRRINDNIGWKQKNYKDVAQWFDSLAM